MSISGPLNLPMTWPIPLTRWALSIAHRRSTAPRTFPTASRRIFRILVRSDYSTSSPTHRLASTLHSSGRPVSTTSPPFLPENQGSMCSHVLQLFSTYPRSSAIYIAKKRVHQLLPQQNIAFHLGERTLLLCTNTRIYHNLQAQICFFRICTVGY